jgi:hypothetical protein
MKNKEKYAREIIEVACSGYCFGMDKSTNKIFPCNCITCRDCVFGGNVDCSETKRKWAESGYIEKPVIRKKDMEFLYYLREDYKFVARDENGSLFVYSSKPYKDITSKCWCVCDCGNSPSVFLVFLNYTVDFPMIKWSDSEPWLIEDLKKLELVEEYEKCLN